MSNYGFDERDTTTSMTREAAGYPQQQMPPTQMPYGYGYGMSAPYGWGRRPMWRGATETKPFFLTSEFVLSLICALGIAITAASSDAFGGWRAWILITAIVASYNLSR